MNIFTIILVYGFSWWIVLFCLLPIGVVSQVEAKEAGNDKDFVEGSAPSAPIAPNLKKKFLWASLIAAAITGIFYLIVTNEIITIEPMT